ncbi:MAG: hypothetical protein CMN30_29770 [Sandaracinus sp.]|nr:hypothetical protein [Sandaracinus sp.]
MSERGSHENELEVPQAIIADSRARELARVWGGASGMTVALNLDAWPDPATWGVALADLVRHLANGYAQARGLDSEASARAIRDAFDAEWHHPTDSVKGNLDQP